MYWLAVAIWVLAAMAAIATPAYLFFKLFKKGLGVLKALEEGGSKLHHAQGTGEKIAAKRQASKPKLVVGPAASENELERATKERQRIARSRQYRKDQRLCKAVRRWQALKIVK